MSGEPADPPDLTAAEEAELWRLIMRYRDRLPEVMREAMEDGERLEHLERDGGGEDASRPAEHGTPDGRTVYFRRGTLQRSLLRRLRTLHASKIH